MQIASRLPRPQLRTRILAGVVLITLVALAAFDIAAISALRGYLLNQTDTRLQNEVQGWQGPALGAGLRADSRFVKGKKVASRPYPGPYWISFVPQHGKYVVFEGPGGLKLKLPAKLNVLAPSRNAVHSFVGTVTSVNGHAQYRIAAVAARGGPHFGPGSLVAAENLTDVNGTVGSIALIVVAGTAAAAAAVGLAVAWLMRRGLRPIEAMAAQADRISAGDLTHRVRPQDTASEVGRLGAALNGMLARIEAFIEEREASQELTRQFFADASHELRTPLASLRANAELYQQGALTRRTEVDEAMRRIAWEAQRMSGLVDDMLRLARLDQHPGQERDPVEVTALVERCAERARITGPEHRWRTEIAPGLVVTGDAELIRRAVDNLLANVRAHTPVGTTATVTATRAGDSVVVGVSDDGPGVPEDQLPRIFERFYRAGAPSARPGSGLGLAIVSAVAAALGGTVRAEPNDPHGLRVTLTLPAAAESDADEPTAVTAGSTG
jgi:two-component system OmpR family sensor kinase